MKDKIIKMKIVHKIQIILRKLINAATNNLIDILQFKFNDDFNNIYKFLTENDVIQIPPYRGKAKNFLGREAKIILELIPDKTIEYFIRSFYG